MKETLQIHHIAKRLPYGVKGILTEEKTSIFHEELWVEDESIFQPNAIWELCGYAPKDLMIPLGEGYFDGFLWRNGMTYVNFHRGILPVMFPLSCLTELITVKGETFIPLVELAQKHFSHIYRKDYQPIAINEVMVYDEVIHRRFKFDNGTFSSTGFDDFMSPVYNQFELFEKLIEWHIDLPHENLIEKGLAISVLDLDKNPYA